MLSEKVLVQTSRMYYKRLESVLSVYCFVMFVPTLSFTSIVIINQIIIHYETVYISRRS